MTITFPTTLDTLSNPASGDALNASGGHALQHANANDAIEALEAKVGIDGSAVTTSLSYKLGGVTGSDKAVSLTGTEVLTNKTLTSPQINLASNATGDIYFRNGSGVFTRLEIGTASQILQVSSGGIPEWIANPSATTASQTSAGIIEIATTAEQTTGTDDTRAATPKSVHDMTSLSGAAWFLDEDTMTSNSDTKTASQQSIKAYIDTSVVEGTINTSVSNTYFTYQVPLCFDDASASNGYIGWDNTNIGDPDDVHGAGGASKILASGANAFLYTWLPGTLSEEYYGADDGKKISIKFRMKLNATTNIKAVGMVTATATSYAAQSSTAESIRFVENAGVLYAQNANGTTATSTDISSGVTRTNWNTYEIIFDPGVDIKYYVNGTLKATHTTNLPTADDACRILAIGVDTNTDYLTISPLLVSLEM